MTLPRCHSASTPRLHPHHLRCLIRTFLHAKVKWVRDPYLDKAVEIEKNLKSLLSLKTLILSKPSQSIPISTASHHKQQLNLPAAAASFIQTYRNIFQIFRPSTPLSLPHVKLTPYALSLHKQETQILSSSIHRKDAAERLAKFLMLTGAGKFPLDVIDRFKFDLGLPPNFILTFLPDFLDYFQICDMGFTDSTGCPVFGLELVTWREDLAVSAMEKTAMEMNFGYRKGMSMTFSMNLPSGFDLEKKVKNWVDEWQKLPYISPYEDAFHLAPNSDQAEKWTVAVLNELLHLLVGYKTERENVFCLGDYLGFGKRFQKALVCYPGIFYISNKIRTQTVVLREAYRKNHLIHQHPLMDMRHRYLDVMNRVWRWGKLIRVGVGRRKEKKATASAKGNKRKKNEWTDEEEEEMS